MGVPRALLSLLALLCAECTAKHAVLLHASNVDERAKGHLRSARAVDSDRARTLGISLGIALGVVVLATAACCACCCVCFMRLRARHARRYDPAEDDDYDVPLRPAWHNVPVHRPDVDHDDLGLGKGKGKGKAKHDGDDSDATPSGEARPSANTDSRPSADDGETSAPPPVYRRPRRPSGPGLPSSPLSPSLPVGAAYWPPLPSQPSSPLSPSLSSPASPLSPPPPAYLPPAPAYSQAAPFP